MDFVNLHQHFHWSNIRLKDCIIKPEEGILYANELGHKAIAITDHESLCGSIKMLKLVKQYKEEGKLPEDFKAIIGNEIYIVDKKEVEEKRAKNERIEFNHLILLAKNKNGFKGLSKLSSNSWAGSFHYKGLERVPTYTEDFFNILLDYRNDIICSTACLGGYIANAYRSYKETRDIEYKKKIHNFITKMKEFFGSSFYLEIQPSFEQEQIEYNKFILALSDIYNVKTIVTTDAHYMKKEHRDFHRCFLNSKDGDREVDSFYSSTYMMDTNEIRSYLIDYVDEDTIQRLFDTTIEINNKIEVYDLYEDVKIPLPEIKDFKIKSAFYQYENDHKYLKMYRESEHEIDRYFFSQIEDGFIAKNKPFNDIYLSRLNEELEVFWEISEKIGQRLSSYFTLTKEIIDDILWSCSYKGVSRGSCSGSLCCQLLSIVDLDPIEHNLPFYRFLSIDRPELPKLYPIGEYKPCEPSA